MALGRAAGRTRPTSRLDGVVRNGFRLAEGSEEHQRLRQRSQRLRPQKMSVGRCHARGASMFRERPILMPESPLDAPTSFMNPDENLRVPTFAERHARRFEIGRGSVRESRCGRHVCGRDQELGRFPIHPVGRVELHREFEGRKAVRFRSALRRLIGDLEQGGSCRLEVMRGQGVMRAGSGSRARDARQRAVNVAPLDRKQVLLDRSGDELMPDLERAVVRLDHEPVLDSLVHPGVQVCIEPIGTPPGVRRRSTRQPVRSPFQLIGHRLERGPLDGLPDQRQEVHHASTFDGPNRQACRHEPAQRRPERHPGEVASGGEDLLGQERVPAGAFRGKEQQRRGRFLALDRGNELGKLITNHRPEFETIRRVGRIGNCREIRQDRRVNPARIRRVGGNEADAIGAVHAGQEHREGPGGRIGDVHILEDEQDRLEVARSLKDAEHRLRDPGCTPIRSDAQVWSRCPLRDQVGQQHPEGIRPGPDDAPQLVLVDLLEE